MLDTNIIIALVGNDSAVLASLQLADEVFLSSVVLGELYYGAQNSDRVTENITRIDEFGTANVVLVCDAITAARYGEVKYALKQKGTPVPENDIWIAALAVQYGLTIVTRDQHFNYVDDVAVTTW